MLGQKLYGRLIEPMALDEDAARRELILNILLIGVIILAGVSFVITVVGTNIMDDSYEGAPPSGQMAVAILFITLLLLSRLGQHRFVSYLFVGVFFLLATLPIVIWGLLLPQAILSYAVVIVMAGVLLSSSAAFYIVGMTAIVLPYIKHLSDSGYIVFDRSWMLYPGGYSDIIVYVITFGVIALVSWLSNREIRRSLYRARASEAALLKERQLLERRVKARTRALEKAQVEKMLDLQHFAEFGKLSATLLHELANPLTSVSIDLEQLEDETRPKTIARAREGINQMEQYVEAARRQLRRSQSEDKKFDVASEIERVADFQAARAKRHGCLIDLDLIEGVSLTGDSIRFNHIVSNLISNAIDAYFGTRRRNKIIYVHMDEKDDSVIVTVIDRGKGIADKHLPHLFEPFYTTKKTQRGTGIGLAITKKAVEEAFHGSISVSSDEKRGTKFEVRLPKLKNRKKRV